jgi:hypothetical protein
VPAWKHESSRFAVAVLLQPLDKEGREGNHTPFHVLARTLSLQTEALVGFGADMYRALLEFQIPHFAMSYFHIPRHRVQEELEHQVFLGGF